MPDLPTGTVTFLFTDIEGSTAHWEQHAGEMQRALARHDAILRQAIEGQGGVVFKTVGDACYAVFTTATAALHAALAAQQALHAEPWPEALGAVRVRMALHTGAAEQRDGDYFGPPLNRVARLLEVGHGGQTLLSFATQVLVHDHLPAGVHLQDLGTHRLRDLIHAERIFQLLAPGLPAAFPLLRTREHPHHNLPAQLTPLVGREQELAQAGALLHRADVRLVTLTGPGGTGKTRLGLHLAAGLLHVFPDGVCFVDLAPIADPALVASTIAQALAVRETPGQSLLESLHTYLHEQHLLLMLDNFEQVVAAAPLLSDLLKAAPRLKLLVTSRIVLHLSGEHEFPVPPLALPDPTHLPPAEQLSQYAAVALFIQRVQAVKPDFAVSNATAPVVAAICARLDGLPLALELAATRVKLLAPEALLARLANRLPLLTGGTRDVTARQRTLRGALDWSYDLLERHEQTLFARLGVFVGGCTVEAAAAVCDPESALVRDLFEILTSLVDQSLLRHVEPVASTGYPEPRFTMLETIREYALERLDRSGEAEAVRQQHAHYYLALAEASATDRRVWLARLAAEHDNLRAALAWSQAPGGAAEVGLRLAGALAWFWYRRGLWSEGRAWLERVLAHPEATGRTPARAKALRDLGDFVWQQGDYAAARARYEESLARCRELGDTQGIALVLNALGLGAREQGDAGRAAALFTESLALFRALGNDIDVAWALCSLAGVAVLQGDAGRATALLEESHALFRQHGLHVGSAWVLNHLGHVAQLEGDYARAAARHAESLPLFRPRDQLGTAWALHSLGVVAVAQGETVQATAWLAESLALFQDLGDHKGIAWCLAGFAGVAWAAQPCALARRAVRLWGAAEALRETLGVRAAPGTRAHDEQMVAAARAQVGEAAWETALSEGRAMTLEQAVAYALEETPDA